MTATLGYTLGIWIGLSQFRDTEMKKSKKKKKAKTHDFRIIVGDGFCDYAYYLTLDENQSIYDIAMKISKKLKANVREAGYIEINNKPND